MTEKVLVKFSAKWCTPCKSLENVMINYSDQIKVDEIQNFDIEDNRDVAIEFGIRSVPTLVLFEDGNEVRRKSGFMNIDQLKEFIG